MKKSSVSGADVVQDITLFYFSFFENFFDCFYWGWNKRASGQYRYGERREKAENQDRYE